jgi:hypothetical protein
MDAIVYHQDETIFPSTFEQNIAIAYENIVCRIAAVENEIGFARMEHEMLCASLDPDEEDDDDIVESLAYIARLEDKLTKLNYIRQALFDRGKRRVLAVMARWQARHRAA